jgi:hypothetical protein
MANNDNSTDSSKATVPSGDAGSAAAKNETTASSKAAARKKQQQQKNQKANPSAKKKQPPKAVRSKFEGIASGVTPMKGIVIAQGNGNMSGQFRVFQRKLAGAAADDKAYGLDSAILELIAKVRSDFVKSRPNPNVHSKVEPVLVAGVPTGENKLLCFDPIMKEQMDAEYSMDLKIQSSNWNQYQRHEEGFYRTALGNVENEVLTHCRRDIRMKTVESNKDLIGFLLILRSVCAANKGSVKVDDEYQNLNTLHQAIGYKQNNTVSNTTYGEDVLARYESAIFTCGKFAFGKSVYDTVLAKYSIPMTFREYMLLSDDDQKPIDEIVKERTVGRLIIKNSLNEQLKEYLVHTYSVNNNSCYPNTISDAVSLLSTFTKAPVTTTTTPVVKDAVVSYHEAEEDIIVEDDIEPDIIIVDDVDNAVDNGVDSPTKENSEDDNRKVSFSAQVMASVIAEATANANENQFIGASFTQLQEVEDVYEEDEPDIVCCAHIVDAVGGYELDDEGDEPLFVTEANINAKERNERIIARRVAIRTHIDQEKDFELMIYHTAQRVLHIEGQNVSIFHYEPGRPDLITHKYNRNVPESIIDYSDALRFKFKQAGVHDTTMLSLIMSSRTDTQVMTVLKVKFNATGMKGINTSTVKILREELARSIAHGEYNNHRWNTMEWEIGVDAMMETFPRANTLLHHVVSAVAINQNRRKPNRWVNKITHKLIDAGITTIELLQAKIESNNLNDHLDDRSMPRLHEITITGFAVILGAADFRQGRF